jgi:hypothetical protein
LDDTGYPVEARVRSVADADFCEERVGGLRLRECSSHEGVGTSCAKPSSEIAIRALAGNLNGNHGGVWPVTLRSRASDKAACQFARA